MISFLWKTLPFSCTEYFVFIFFPIVVVVFSISSLKYVNDFFFCYTHSHQIHFNFFFVFWCFVHPLILIILYVCVCVCTCTCACMYDTSIIIIIILYLNVCRFFVFLYMTATVWHIHIFFSHYFCVVVGILRMTAHSLSDKHFIKKDDRLGKFVWHIHSLQIIYVCCILRRIWLGIVMRKRKVYQSSLNWLIKVGVLYKELIWNFIKILSGSVNKTCDV